MPHVTSRPRARQGLVWSGGVLMTLVFALLLVTPTTGSGPVTPAESRLRTTISGPCLGAGLPGSASGTLVLNGTSTPLPSVTGVPVRVDYFYTQETTLGTTTTESCVPANATASTGTGGSIDVPLSLPTDRCGADVCYDYYGPYGPLGYATSGAPDGYTEVDPTGGVTPSTIYWYADLAGAAINRSGTVVVSVNAPSAYSASATDARGAPATGPLTYAWSLVGLDWTPATWTGPNVTVQGSDAGWVGSLTVTVSATYGTTVESATSATLSLLPLATQATNGSTSPDPVDPGVPVTFAASGSGAAGYPYTFTVDPGLGAEPVSAPCTSTSVPNGTVNLTCRAVGAYAAAGNVTPTATISNGYSAATLYLPAASIHPVEQVTLAASTYVTYPNRTVTLTVNVTNGTGSPPYGPVCLAVNGTPSLTCQTGAGLSWSFEESFASPGRYELRAYVADRFGENVSGAAGIVVVPALEVRTTSTGPLVLRSNTSGELVAVVSGGEPPFSALWNDSGGPLPSCNGVLDLDGEIRCAVSSPLPGPFNVTLTMIDALGSQSSVLFRILVTASPAGPCCTVGTPLSDGVIVAGGLAGVLALVGLVLLLRRRRAAQASSVVEEDELERMARGREHLLAHSDPVEPRRPEELVRGWTGPPVRAEEWAEWIAALVSDGSLLPVRGEDHRLAYRRAPPPPSAATIRFDPSVLDASWVGRDRDPDAEPPSPPDHGGG